MISKGEKIEYPCTKCGKTQWCVFRDCEQYMAWLHQEWGAIREAAQQIKDRRTQS